MRLKALVFTAAVAAGAALGPQLAAAAALPGGAGQAVQSHATEQTIKQDVRKRRRWHRRHYRHRRYHRPRRYGRCVRVRRSCAARFGWRTRGYFRCARYRGC